MNDANLRFDEFELDATRRRLLRDGEIVSLNAKAFELLAALVERRGEIVTKDELFETVWKGQVVEENNLTVHVAALRKALGEKKGAHRFIVTVPGEGYKFVGELLVPEPTGLVIENRTIERITVDEIEVTQPALPGRRRTIAPFIAAVAVLIAVAAAWVWFERAKTAPIGSIAVMPFSYEGGNPDSEFLTDGMTETMISNLSQLPKLTVKARASVFSYKGKAIDPRQVAGELSVQALLLGRVVERGDQLVLSLELVDARTGNQVWGEQYTRKTAELATLQGEIAREVANKLSRRLGGGKLPGGGTSDAEAYRLYVKGRYFWNKRNHQDHLKALELFRQAIDRDPNFALAYAAIGDVNVVDSYKLPNAEKLPVARAAAAKALEIEPDLDAAYAVLGSVAWSEFNWDESERHFQRALAINPNNASARQWHAEMMLRRGMTEEAIAEIGRALELDPLSLIINSDAAYIYVLARQYDRGLAQAERTLELDPNWPFALTWRGLAKEYKGDFAGAMTDFNRWIEISDLPAERKALLINDNNESLRAAQEGGAEAYWLKTIEVLKRRPPDAADYFGIGYSYAHLDRVPEALDALEIAVERAEPSCDFLKVEPAFDRMRAEPRFRALLKKMNLDD